MLKGVVDTYDGVVPKMRSRGSTLQEIGNKCGVSKERIRQVLLKYYPYNLYPDAFTTSQLASELGTSSARVRVLCRKLSIQPLRNTKGRGHIVLWNKSTLPLLIRSPMTKCKTCGKPVHYPRTVYCSDSCHKESMKIRSRPKEVKERHKSHVYKWMKSHPKELKVINQRAQRRYWDKILRKRKYTIVRKCKIPMGATVSNAGRAKNVKIPVKWEGKIYYFNPSFLKKR